MNILNSLKTSISYSHLQKEQTSSCHEFHQPVCQNHSKEVTHIPQLSEAAETLEMPQEGEG